jgi:hypothetical protein
MIEKGGPFDADKSVFKKRPICHMTGFNNEKQVIMEEINLYRRGGMDG